MNDERDDLQARRARRAWIAANHPDRGGDPDAFVDGLRDFAPLDPDAGASAGAADPRPTVHRSRSPWRRLRFAVRQVQRARRGQPRRRLD